jgi:hypothetical protein
MSERSMDSFAPETSGDISQRVLPSREKEDREIVDTVIRLYTEKQLTIIESCALFHVLKVDPKFWPDWYAPTFPGGVCTGGGVCKKHNWQWSDEERTKIAEDLKESILLRRADAIAWAQAFIVRETPHNLAGYRKDNNGRYPKFQSWFANFIVQIRAGFIEDNKPEPIRPSEEKSDGKGSGGTGGMGFLIGAVVIALLAVGILMYFLLR